MKVHDMTEQAFKNGYEKGKQEVAREIFEVINDIVESWKVVEYSKETGDVIRTSYNGTMVAKCLAELKKKYTGGTEQQ